MNLQFAIFIANFNFVMLVCNYARCNAILPCNFKVCGRVFKKYFAIL
jgi:hypothetical protein